MTTTAPSSQGSTPTKGTGGGASNAPSSPFLTSPPPPALSQALAAYCSAVDPAAGTAGEGTEPPQPSSFLPSSSPDASIPHLNTVLLHVQRSKRFEEVVAQMGPYLTSEEGRVRTRAAALLGEVLNRLPALPLTDAAVHHFVEFFSSRLSDFPSVAGSLLALRALLQHHGGPARKEADVIARAIFKDVHVPSMTQTIRQRTFEVLFEMTGALEDEEVEEEQQQQQQQQEESEDDDSSSGIPTSLLEMQTDFIRGLVDCVEGEKDPRCLILCLKVISRAQSAFPQAADAHIEALFDVTACYFPITFTPPPNDPYGITPDMLAQALREALTTRPSMAQFLLPLLVDKLTSTHVPAKLEALLTLQTAARTIGVRAMRLNLPSLTGALFQEVVSCPEAAVVAQALESCRVLAAHLSSPDDENVVGRGAKAGGRKGGSSRSSKKVEDEVPAVAGAGAKTGSSKKKAEQEKDSKTATITTTTQEPDDERVLAEADWQAFLLHLVAKAVSEVKANPDSLKGRACARLLTSIARASARAYSAVLKSTIPITLQLVMAGKKSKPGRVLEEEEGGKQQAALLLLVDLVEAVDPSLDFSATAEGPPLSPYVPQLHATLLECLGSPASGPALLAVKGLASLATRSPSDLLSPAQTSSLVTLFTARLQAEERTVGPAYDPDLAQALLQGLRALSSRRKEHTEVVLAHTLPELLKWMDEATTAVAAAAGGGAGGMTTMMKGSIAAATNGVSSSSSSKSNSSSSSSSSSSSPELERCLGALAFLAGQAEVFQAVVPSLLNRVLVSPTTATEGRGGVGAMEVEEGQGVSCALRVGEGTTHILSSLATIFVSTSAVNHAALPALLALPPSPLPSSSSSSSVASVASSEAMEVEKELSSSPSSPSSSCLWSLQTAILSSAAQGRILDNAALEATLRVFGAATEALPPSLQDLLALRLLRFFVAPSSSPSSSSSSIFDVLDAHPPPALGLSIAGLQPLLPSTYPSQAQALSVLLIVLGSLHIASPIFASPGIKDVLLPAVVRLTLQEAPEADNSSTSSSSSSSSSSTPSSLPEPACWGAALLVNKAAMEGVVAEAVTTLLSGFKQRLATVSSSNSSSSSSSRSLATARRDVASLVWLTKALALRCAPKKSMEEAVSLLIDVAGCATPAGEGEAAATAEPSPARLALARQAAEGFGLILRDASPPSSLPSSSSSSSSSFSLTDRLLAPRPSTARVNPLWRQRLYYLSFARLREAVDRHRARPQAKAAALLAVCNMVGSLPQPIIQAELEPIMLVVLQGMSSVSSNSNSSSGSTEEEIEEEKQNAAILRARATETFVALVKDSLEAVMPHLATVVPLLYQLCTPSDPHFLPKAKLRVLALGSLLEITRLPYAKLHPYRAMVSRGLLAPLDDRKRVVRQMAVKVRNEWMVMDR